MSGSSKPQERWARCAAMDPDKWARFLKGASRRDLENLLRRYEWLMEFVMAAPDCAELEEQRELVRRVEQLRELLALEEPRTVTVELEVSRSGKEWP